MKNIILFLGISFSVLSCSSSKPDPVLSDAQLEAASTKQYNEPIDIVHKSIYRKYAYSGYSVVEGPTKISAFNLRGSLGYESYTFYLNELNSNLTEVKLVFELEGALVRNLANIPTYEKIWQEIGIEIEKQKAYNK